MEHNVLRFDVSVYNLQRVDLIDCLTDLPHYEGNSSLREGL